MLKFLIFGLLFAFASADIDAVVTRFVNEVNPDGSYRYEVAQSNDAQWQEAGVGGQIARGAFQYVSPEGALVQLAYNADENGFQPQSNWLPTPPPIPDYILRAIDYIRKNPTQEELADQAVRARQI